jgi:hypothetical protein
VPLARVSLDIITERRWATQLHLSVFEDGKSASALVLSSEAQSAMCREDRARKVLADLRGHTESSIDDVARVTRAIREAAERYGIT